jgi:hypothetical protein
MSLSSSGKPSARRLTRLRRYLLLWRGRRKRFSIVTTLAGLGAVVLVVLTLSTVLSWILPVEGGFFGADTSCDNNGFACGALTELLGTALALAVAAASFVYWRVFKVAHQHLKGGLENPASLVPTATPMGRVVGRDALCGIIEADLRDKDRRPQIIVAGVGEGKTAVLVRLTQLLIERCAMPVPVRLRDAEVGFDFLELAKTRFMERVRRVVLSEDEADKVWRKLCNDKRVVVLADGLEEALYRAPERHQEIRRAVDSALQERVPLVITSRPHEALRGLDAAMIRLEPLSKADALDYMANGHESSETLQKLVEAAEVTESPLYLRLASELGSDGQLEGMPTDQGRLAVRVELLERWRERLLSGVDGAAPNLRPEREAAFEGLEAMACIALRRNTLELRLDDFENEPERDRIGVDVKQARRAASVGEDLGLVERVRGGVRFRHSIMEAYLGARALPKHAAQPLADRLRRRLQKSSAPGSYVDRALEDPGRELLMALTVASFRTRRTHLPRRLEHKLKGAALTADSDVAFDLLATAYEVDRAVGRDATTSLGRTATKLWKGAGGSLAASGDPRLDESKMRAVAQMEETGGVATYRALWSICRAEDAYRVRLRAAQALAEGGPRAHSVLEVPIDDALRLGRRLGGRRARHPGPGEVRLCSLMGWILPSLAASCSLEDPRRVPDITSALEGWIELSRDGLHLGIEACLAQGFKYEANRLPHRTSKEARARLVELARELLDTSGWWYSQLALVQALTLSSLGTNPAERAPIRKLLEDWTRDERHPLVREAARLCQQAVEDADNRHSEKARAEASAYLWIDEAGTVSRIGAGTVLPDPRSTDGLWVSPAAGWSTLDPAARWLVGNVFVYLNLIEGGEASPSNGLDPETASARLAGRREKRRQTVREQGTTLPPCLTAPDGMMRLRSEREHGTAEERRAQGTCDCEFGLCPYPASDQQPFRGEAPETFCRGQKRLARDEGPPPWYEASRAGRLPGRRSAKDELEDFWSAMENRAQRVNTVLLASDDDSRWN